MECPKCGEQTSVTRTVSDSGYTYRKRICKSCKYIYYTKEQECDSYEALNSINFVYSELKRINRLKHKNNI